MNHPRHPDFPNDDHDDEWGSSFTGSGEFDQAPILPEVPRPSFLPRLRAPFTLLDWVALIILTLGCLWGVFVVFRYFLPLLLALFFGV